MRHRITLLVAALAVVTMAASPTLARAAPGHGWSYPFCGPQPSISAVYDHEYPTYGCSPNGNDNCSGANDSIRLYNNDEGSGRFAYEGHNGWDYRTRAADGTNVKRPVFAVADGVVTYAGWQRPGAPNTCPAEHESSYGLVIRVRHGGEEALYGHLSALFVEVGDRVWERQMLGTTGSTGNSTGPHLHFGAFRPDGPALSRSFDAYGWNADWEGLTDRPLPVEDDPWFAYAGVRSERRILPGAPDNRMCYQTCGAPIVVDDQDPGFSKGCASGNGCGYWLEAAAGYANHVFYTYPNGQTRDYWARWTAPAAPGTYAIEAYVPVSGRVATARAARYRVGDRTVVVDQHREGDVWVGLGVYAFRGVPSVELVDAVYIPGNYSYIGECQTVGADAVRFIPLCGDPGVGVPVIEKEQER